MIWAFSPMTNMTNMTRLITFRIHYFQTRREPTFYSNDDAPSKDERRGYASAVIVRRHDLTVCPCAAQGHQIAPLGNRQELVFAEGIRTFANRANDIVFILRAIGICRDVLNVVVRLIECGTYQVRHAGIEDNEFLVIAFLHIEHAADERSALAYHAASQLEMQFLSASQGKVARVALRVNPNVDAHTHKYITTGLSENKFGIAMNMLDMIVQHAHSLPNISFEGLHFHIGSQILDMKPFEMLCHRVNQLQEELEAKGVRMKTINVGGGLGCDYVNPDEHPIPDFASYFKIFAEHLTLRRGQELHFELGRSVVCQCGALISRVLYVKEGNNKKFVILDAGMSDLIRPALYQAHHNIENITAAPDGPKDKYDVVGPICESSDTFGEDEVLPVTRRGDLVALRSAGAYGQIMASNYNCRRIPSSLVL